MSNILFSRTDSPNSKSIIDGQVIFDTSGNGKMYLDVGTKRLPVGGALDVDTKLDATSTNPIQNKGVAGVMLGELEEIRCTTKKGFLTDALATKTLDAKIGITDISSIGDGTVTGAISDVNGKLSSKLDSSKILLSTTPQMRFSIYDANPDDYDIDFRRSETTIIKFRFHITNSNVDVYETRDNGASWTQRRSGNNYIQ